MSDVVDRIARQRVLPVLRSESPELACAVASALTEAGADAIELTQSTPDVLSAVRVLADRGLCIGLGTIRDAAEIAPAAEAGAAFVVSFANPPDFVATAHRCGLAAIPGGLTPHEVLQAAMQGADAVKVFPARAVSPAHLGDLRNVMPQLRILVTGGIPGDPEAVATWLAAGACAVGLGGALSPAGAEPTALTAVAAAFRRLAAAAPAR